MHQSIPPEHTQHDLDLIAGHAAGDLTTTERIRADDLLNSCASCAELRRDLLAIASATRTLPSAAAAPRDFRLTPRQAASLRRGSWLATLLRPFAAPRSTVRPLAMAFTSLGLAGLLFTNILPALFGSAASLAPQAGLGGAAPAAATAAPAPAPSQAAEFPVAAGPHSTSYGRELAGGVPTFVADQGGSSGSKSNEATTPSQFAGNENQASGTGQPSDDRLSVVGRERITQETNPILIGSLILLALGLALFGLRFVARRLR